MLPQLSSRHQVIVAAVTDPRVDQLAAGRADAAQVYDAAAAEQARNDRRAIASRLRHSGVGWSTRRPMSWRPRWPIATLSMKATGRL